MRKSISVAFFSTVSALMVLGIVLLGIVCVYLGILA